MSKWAVVKNSSPSVRVIAKSGKPMVKVVPVDAPEDSEVRRIGVMEGLIDVQDDFDLIGADEIEKLVGGA
jgi:antitoxin (DNA-binding transcriptional repressor) of toxin-antitoxin stability system